MRRKKSSHKTLLELLSKNFLTNISNNGLKEEDLFDRSFVSDD